MTLCYANTYVFFYRSNYEHFIIALQAKGQERH